MSKSFACFAITPTYTFTLDRYDNAAHWLPNLYDLKSLTLCWRSHWSHWNSLCTFNNCMQPIIYSVLTSSIMFVCIIVCIQEFCYLSITDQLLSTLSEWEMMWSITFSRFRPAIEGMWIISLVFSKYSSIFSPFLIQLLLLNFYNVPQAISNISTMCTRSVRRVMQLDT